MTPEEQRAAAATALRAIASFIEAAPQPEPVPVPVQPEPQESELAAIVRPLLTLHEGKRNRLYQDTVGLWTGGVGHNFSDRGLSDAAIDFILREDMAVAEEDARTWLGADAWEQLEPARKAALIDLSFNLGGATLSQFQATRALLRRENYAQAATNLMASKWAGQVGKAPGQRAYRITEMIRTGKMPTDVPGLKA